MDNSIDPEVWRPIEDSRTEYEVSNHGRVRRGFKGKVPKVLEPIVTSGGYLCIKIYGNPEKLLRSVSELVASAFLPVPEYPDIMYISFIDGDKKNVRADNLRYRVKTKPPIGRW